MFIAQMNCPNFRVLSDFRKKARGQALQFTLKKSTEKAQGQVL